MTGSDLRTIRLTLGLSPDQWGRALGYAPSRARTYAHDLEAERARITPAVQRLAEMFARHPRDVQRYL